MRNRFLIMVTISIVTILLLTACEDNQKTENYDEVVSTTIIQENKEEITTLEDVQKVLKFIENREDYYDESGEILYYIEDDYMEADTENEAIRKIAANYPKKEIDAEEQSSGYSADIVRMYPGEIYYTTTKYDLSSIHNGILNIHINHDFWWGSPHPYPSFECANYLLSTGEEYELPDEIKEDVYEEVVNTWMQNAKDNNYEGLLGDYYREDNLNIQYTEYDEETGETTVNEEVLKDIVKARFENYGCFEIYDDKISFYTEAAYSLSGWATRGYYSCVEIDNKWDL